MHTKRQPAKPLWSDQRKKTPTVLQMEAVECGAAALGIILAYHGKFIPLEELRLECGVSRDGSKASNILRAARKYGFKAQGFRKEPHQLTDLPFPMILFWNFNHFVVLEGIKGDVVYINDPAEGPRKLSKEEFDQAFTGVTLSFIPESHFQKGGQKKSLFTALKKRLANAKFALTYVILAGLFLVIPGLIVPTFLKIFVDNILILQKNNWLKPLLLAMALVLIIRALLTWLQQYYLLRLETKLALSTSAKFFTHVFKLPIDFFSQRFGGEIGRRVQINDSVAQLLSGDLATNFLNVIMIVFYAILMLQYDFYLTGISIVIALFNIAALYYVSRKRVDLNQRLKQEMGKLMGVTMNGLQIIESLKAGGNESDFYTQWSGYQAKVINAQQELAVATRILSAIPPFLLALNNVAILSFGGLRIMDGQLSMGSLIAFQSLMFNFITPVNEMIDLGSKIQEVKGDMNRLDDVLHHQTDPSFSIDENNSEKNDFINVTGKPHTAKLSGEIELCGISFGYNRLEPPLIKNFNMKVLPGSRVAIVGSSGSGKSTVAKLLTSLYRPWKGEIYFDGEKMENIERDLVRNSIALVEQDISMFSGSVRENLTMWDNTINDATIIRAAKDSCIHETIAERANGYDSFIDEDGRNYSGGQRQRLEIARALCINPNILVLDEATSALDPTTEKEIDDNLRRRGCTCVIIAHRLSTIRDCDEIIVLEQGQVVQRGTHEEMKHADGPYARLIREQ
jgi:NHLM bacteriocin system ABC transporter peptidase/ATP-binding protein